MARAGNASSMRTIDGAAELIVGLSVMDESLKRSVKRKMLTAAANAIKKQVRRRTPRSRITGTQDKWSESLRARRGDVRDALRKSLDSNPSSKWRKAARARQQGILGVTVRHLYPQAMNRKGSQPIGPHAHLVERGHRGVFWGKSTGHVRAYPYFWKGVAAATPELRGIVLAKGRQAIEKARQAAAKKAKK